MGRYRGSPEDRADAEAFNEETVLLEWTKDATFTDSERSFKARRAGLYIVPKSAAERYLGHRTGGWIARPEANEAEAVNAQSVPSVQNRGPVDPNARGADVPGSGGGSGGVSGAGSDEGGSEGETGPVPGEEPVDADGTRDLSSRLGSDDSSMMETDDTDVDVDVSEENPPAEEAETARTVDTADEADDETEAENDQSGSDANDHDEDEEVAEEEVPEDTEQSDPEDRLDDETPAEDADPSTLTRYEEAKRDAAAMREGEFDLSAFANNSWSRIVSDVDNGRVDDQLRAILENEKLRDSPRSSVLNAIGDRVDDLTGGADGDPEDA